MPLTITFVANNLEEKAIADSGFEINWNTSKVDEARSKNKRNRLRKKA